MNEHAAERRLLKAIFGSEQELTPEEAEAKLRAERTRRALRDAPAITFHVRMLAINGQTERGETLPEWTAPMRIQAVDDIDDLYAILINWVDHWAELLSGRSLVNEQAWRNFREVQGFRAGTTPRAAQLLMSRLTNWLRDHMDIIAKEQPTVLDLFQTEIVDKMATLRGRYPTAPHRQKDVSARPCEVCGHFAVVGEWNSENDLDVTVKCEHCGNIIDAPPAQLAKWLEVDDRTPMLSQECADEKHADCESLLCGCSCHLWPSAFVGKGVPSAVRYEPRDRFNRRKVADDA